MLESKQGNSAQHRRDHEAYMAWKKKSSLARITFLNCIQDDLLIKYEVYQTAHEMWQALKEKVWQTFSNKAERTCNEIWKL